MLYSAAYLRFYLASPAGRFPTLDGAENVELAREIASGTLSAAPFYRAMLYPGALSLFLRAGVSVEWLPLVAALLGCALHIGSTLNVYWLSRRCWASPKAGLVAAALFGLNPVAVYFSAEPLDTTLGLFFFLSGLNILHSEIVHGRRTLGLTALGFAEGTFLWVLATLTRPHYAIVLAGLPFLIVAYWWWRRRRTGFSIVAGLGGFLAAAVFGLGGAGMVQMAICGQFRIMPAQGAYNLWAGNRPGANGRYFEQKIHLPAGSNSKIENPARVESEVLYRQETGDSAPNNLDRMNAYWQHKTIAAIEANPSEWLKLMVRKVYYLFNNFEQYNNKTFAIQKSLTPVLRFNPLGWGVTLVVCAAGLALFLPRLRGRPMGWPFLGGTAAFYAAGVLIFFVSDRFRLPLLPFICIGSGVWGLARRGATGFKKPQIAWAGVAVAVLTGLITFSRAWGVYDLGPAIQDYILLSTAAGKAGADREELRWARLALRCQPQHPDALACAVTSFYNLKLQGAETESEFPGESWELEAQRVARIPQPAPSVRLVQGVALWKVGRVQEATNVWRELLENGGSIGDDALGMLLLAGLESPGDLQQAASRANETGSFYLLSALGRRERAANPLVPTTRREELARTEPFVRNIFPEAPQ